MDNIDDDNVAVETSTIDLSMKDTEVADMASFDEKFQPDHIVYHEGHLCEACQEVPWGRQGWSDLFANESCEESLSWVFLTELKQMLMYTVEPSKFYEQTKICAWCNLLVTETKDREGETGFLRTLEPVAWERLFKEVRVKLSFPTTKYATPSSFNRIEVSLSVRFEDTLVPFQLSLGVYSRPGKLPKTWETVTN